MGSLSVRCTIAGGMRRTHSQASSPPNDATSIAALAKQLVQSRLSEANAQRQLK